MAEAQNWIVPDFKLNSIPEIKLKNLHIVNYKAYDDYHMDFSDGSGIFKPFICFIGENGVGKSTALNAIQLIFTSFSGMTENRIEKNLGKCVRHVEYSQDGIYSNKDFLIEADISSSFGDYTVRINKSGFIDDHPKEIKTILYRLCYYAKFDQELHQFQLIRDRWGKFKKLFESVTGFEINEIEDLFSSSEDSLQKEMMEKYVLGFTVKKPFETISNRECSNGERKVIKSFSTMLNLEIPPRIILIDDIAMHVALKRHISLIDAMKSCYPNSQIFSTTHSYRMTKNLKRRSEIYDLRTIHADIILKNEPWRLRIIDEIEDSMYKLEGLEGDRIKELYNEGENFLNACYRDIKDLQKFQSAVSIFLKEVSDLYVIEMMSCDK